MKAMKWHRITEPNIYAYHALLFMTEEGYCFVGICSGPGRYLLSMSNPPNVIEAKVKYYAYLQDIEPADPEHCQFGTDEAALKIAQTK